MRAHLIPSPPRDIFRDVFNFLHLGDKLQQVLVKRDIEMGADLIPSPSSSVFWKIFDLLYLINSHQRVIGERGTEGGARLVASPASCIIHEAIVSVFVSPVSAVTISIITHNSRFLVILVSSISVIIDNSLVLNYGVVSAAISTTVAIVVIDEGLILNDCVPTTSVISTSTVITTLLISISTAAFEIFFKLFLVSVPVLLYLMEALVTWSVGDGEGSERSQVWTYQLCGLRASTRPPQPIQPLLHPPRMPSYDFSAVGPG